MIISKDEFLAAIDSLRAEVEKDASMEGSLRYEWGDEPDTYRVGAFIRVGNDVGQGGVMLIQEDWEDETGG